MCVFRQKLVLIDTGRHKLIKYIETNGDAWRLRGDWILSRSYSRLALIN